MTMQQKLFEQKSECCGCTACYNVCPKNAITMKSDTEGFKYPVLDSELCIGCGKCLTVCPLKVDRDTTLPIDIFAAKNKNEEVRMGSSSGGVFSVLASYVESNQGTIYGVVFDEYLLAIHKRALHRHEWERFITSKYMQSELHEIFKQIKNDLISNKMVLFTGTPCQVDALKRYLINTDCSRLITCDIVCHGVTSPMIWKEYLKFVKKTHKIKVASVNFRDKSSSGWHDSRVSLYDRNGNKILSDSKSENLYFQLYFNHFILRPSCHNCHYANLHRPGDITIGDYWGIEKFHKAFDDDKGVSLCFCNTIRGVEVWKEIEDQVEYIYLRREECMQPNLYAPSPVQVNRKRFWEKYIRDGFESAVRSVGLLPYKLTLKEKVYSYYVRIKTLLIK